MNRQDEKKLNAIISVAAKQMNGRVYYNYADYEDDVAKVVDGINEPFIDKIAKECLKTPGALMALQRFVRNGIRDKAEIIFKQKREGEDDNG